MNVKCLYYSPLILHCASHSEGVTIERKLDLLNCLGNKSPRAKIARGELELLESLLELHGMASASLILQCLIKWGTKKNVRIDNLQMDV